MPFKCDLNPAVM